MDKVSVSVDECQELNLKPCPFCGTSRLAIWEGEHNEKKIEWVECTNSRCGISGPMWRKTRGHHLAIKYWNQREPQFSQSLSTH